MKIHLVGGFLGSGKTTAIAVACQHLKQQGLKVGVITNDQGQYLVDSEFLEAEGISSAQVTGGCFCCNYDQLDEQIQLMKAAASPDIIFAESVGSCTDLVATVLKPLLKFRQGEMEMLTLSCFVDARMLLMHVEGKRLPFSKDTSYIWEKQIEEASLIVVNKIDLISAADLPAFKLALAGKYPDRKFLFQNSLELDSVLRWLTALDVKQDSSGIVSLDIDYAKYANGEAELAWLDEQITMETTDGSAPKRALDLVRRFVARLSQSGASIGHVKVMVSANGLQKKLSFTTLATNDASVEELLTSFGAQNLAQLTMNARVQTSPEMLRAMLVKELAHQKQAGDVVVSEQHVSFFKPGFPTPIHRFEVDYKAT
ncbi:MAG: GTP-binding protein [Imperialibacter sp.]|uniref:GTP-binding protein n=1 Tax=Imperialibacter sp. TaxID=2038411 RepID=UPI0032EDF756